MSLLPDTPLKLNGSCLCSAIRYTITIPSLPSRPLIPKALPTPISTSGDTVPTRFPLIELDHCTSCRRGAGAIIQCWIIVPWEWIEFQLQPRDSERAAGYQDPFIASESKGVGGAVVVPTSKDGKDSYMGYYESSPDTHRTFCTRCGTSLSFCFAGDRGPEWKLGPIVDIAVGTLDEESLAIVRPERHGWWDDGVDWVKELVKHGDGGWLMRHPTGRINSQV